MRRPSFLAPKAPSAARNGDASDASRHPEAGDTLLEVMIAVLVLGLTSVALLIAFATTISASAEHRKLANVDTVLASAAAESTSLIQQQGSALFDSCQPLSAYPSSSTLSSGLPSNGGSTAKFTVQILSVAYWNGSTFPSDSPACSTFVKDAPQEITIEVTDNVNSYPYFNSFVVDDPAPPPSPTYGAATQLVFSTQPAGATYGTAFAIQPVVTIEDANGNVVANDLSPMTITLTPGTGSSGASLTGCAGSETSGIVTFGGCSIDTLGSGYTLTVSDNGLTATSAAFDVSPIQLATPVITSVSSSTTTAGALTVAFTGSSNAPPGQTYSVKACTDSSMSVGCVTQSSLTSGSDVVGLNQGSNYYVRITADASTDYLAASTPPSGPTFATVQLNAPTGLALAYGPTAGSLSATYTASTNAAPGQSYTLKLCTNSGMSSNCSTHANFASPSSLTGLSYSVGSAGTTYYATLTADASTGFLASAPSSVASHADTSQYGGPGTPSVASSTTTAGAVTATFSAPSGATPPSYSATACTDSAMTTGCVTNANYTSGAQFTGLVQGLTYYVTITSNASPGMLANTSGTSAPVFATVQLNAPTGLSVSYGTVAGSLSVTFNPSSNAAPGQTYSVKACKDSAMTTGCVTSSNYVSGSNLTGLSYTAGTAGTTYYVTVSANASTNYFASPPSGPVSHPDTSVESSPSAGWSDAGLPGGSGEINAWVSTLSSPTPTTYTCYVYANSGLTQLLASGPCSTSSASPSIFATGLGSGSYVYIVVTAISADPAYASATSPYVVGTVS